MNLWLWDHVLPGWRDWDPETWLVGVGTLLNRKRLPKGRFLVLGSGAGYGRAPTLAGMDGAKLGFVRGPRTARMVGVSRRESITDPAMLVARINMFRDVERTGASLFVPHWRSDIDPAFDWSTICQELGIKYLSPRGDAREVIAAIAGADRVLSESMHGAIIADAFRVEWQPVALGGKFNDFKWQDWGESLSLDIDVPRFGSRFFAKSPWISSPHQPYRLIRKVVGKLPRFSSATHISTSEREKLHREVLAFIGGTMQRRRYLSDGHRLEERLDMMEERLAAVSAAAR